MARKILRTNGLEEKILGTKELAPFLAGMDDRTASVVFRPAEFARDRKMLHTR